MLGEATDNEVLIDAGIKHAVGVFAVAHDDLVASMVYPNVAGLSE